MSIKFETIPTVTVVRIPKFKAITSGFHAIEDDGFFGAIWDWELENESILPPLENFTFGSDFYILKNGKYNLISAINDDVTEAQTTPFEIIDFKGGLFASAICVYRDNDSLEKVEDKIMKWIDSSNFIFDNERNVMGQLVYEDEEIYKGLGYRQFLKYVPIKLRTE